MSARFLLDTNVCIHLINRGPQVEMLAGRIGRYGRDQVLISSITLAELEFGIAKSQRRAQNRLRFGLFLAQFEIALFDPRAAAFYGPLRASLQAVGKLIGPLDTLIAAHALALDTCLVTHNVREIERVPGLRIEDWFAGV
jgi:tRNA(fMet)-specific endonuclease VapC